MYAGLTALGEYQFEVRAKDLQGLYDASPATRTWTIAAAPVPREITCGEIVVQSIIVQNDLVDCLGNGLIIGSHGITIDLDGHLIDGTGIDIGILNNGFDNVTIRTAWSRSSTTASCSTPGRRGTRSPGCASS